jgi:hypothetical protein
VREKYCWLVADKPSEQAGYMAGRYQMKFDLGSSLRYGVQWIKGNGLPFSFFPSRGSLLHFKLGRRGSD